MAFNSHQFLLIFFPLVVLGHFLIPQGKRWALLLAASYLFYACWNVSYLLLIVVITLAAYVSGHTGGVQVFQSLVDVTRFAGQTPPGRPGLHEGRIDIRGLFQIQ